ncbi:MAG: DHH family phosphoesterase [Flavobacteriales bacterium]|nr:DHH family phosphoesterase [Flavobacteriales bacterium]
MSFLSADTPSLLQLRELLSSPRQCVIVTHYNPDGDAMGSSLGLMNALQALGHRAQVVFPNTPASFLHWMPGYGSAITADTHPEQAKNLVCSAEVLFCLDFNKPDRVGLLEESLRAAPFRVLVDHHQRPDTFARITFSDTTSCATCQMVYDILVALKAEEHIDREVATCLYTGVMTDSGSFRYSSTTPHTLRVAAALMEKGAVPDHVFSAVMDDNSEQRLKLLGFTLAERMTVHPQFGTAVIVLEQKDLDRFQFAPGDTEGFVNYGLSIRGVRLAAFFVERPDRVKISLRSKGALPVDQFLSAHFDGGGHANAAGGQSTSPLPDVVARFMELLPAFIAEHPA